MTKLVAATLPEGLGLGLLLFLICSVGMAVLSGRHAAVPPLKALGHQFKPCENCHRRDLFPP